MRAKAWNEKHWENQKKNVCTKYNEIKNLIPNLILFCRFIKLFKSSFKFFDISEVVEKIPRFRSIHLIFPLHSEQHRPLEISNLKLDFIFTKIIMF